MLTRHLRLRALAVAGVLLTVVVVVGCESAYYGAMERVGVHKREILVDRVEEARDAQEDAKEQFASALEAFSAVVEVEAGELEDTYGRLQREFDRSEARAEDVRDRIEAVESVSEALFEEWEREIEDYTSESLRRESASQLRRTRQRYEDLIGAMWRAEARIEPVLDAFRDQVLYLKHNLNARAVAALRGELDSIQRNVAQLVMQMERAIAESEDFIASMQTER